MLEVIKKIGSKYVLYPKKGGKRLGTHDTEKSARNQEKAIKANEIIVVEKQNCGCLDIYNVREDWSQKYKKSIDCNNPKGFSQKAHCAGRKKK